MVKHANVAVWVLIASSDLGLIPGVTPFFKVMGMLVVSLTVENHRFLVSLRVFRSKLPKKAQETPIFVSFRG